VTLRRLADDTFVAAVGQEHRRDPVLPGTGGPAGKGLQVKLRGSGWIQGIAPDGHTIVQVGDMLQYLTGGYLRSAVHRIDAPAAPTGRSRYSSPLFIYPRADVDLRPDQRWAANPLKYRSITAAAFFEARLRTVRLDAAA
jgi:isopenicillin N synthase-like dioxygenase